MSVAKVETAAINKYIQCAQTLLALTHVTAKLATC